MEISSKTRGKLAEMCSIFGHEIPETRSRHENTIMSRCPGNIRRPQKYNSVYWDHIASDNTLSEPVTNSQGEDVILLE